MRKINLLLLTAVFPLFLFAQPVQFALSNKASFSLNGIDTLKFPYTGGLNAPQFCKFDLDGNGVKDLLVFDRSGNKLLTFLFDKGDYKYAPQFESQFPPLFGWVIVRDFNCDGRDDIFTEVDFNAQPEKDKFISNNGIRVLRNISTQPGKLLWKQDLNQLMDSGLNDLPSAKIGITAADLIAVDDVDNDGDLDILQMPFGKNVITYYQNLSKEMGYNCDSLKFIFRDECWGYMSYLVNSNGFLLGDQSACYRNYKTAKHNGTTLSLLDMDADGDKDLIYGDWGFSSLIYLENGKTINKLKRDSIISQDTLFPKNSVQAKIDIWPASFLIDVDNDGKQDMVVAPNVDAAAQNNNQVMYYKNTSSTNRPVFTYQNNQFIVGQTLDLGGGSIPIYEDLDGDGDQDLVIATQGEYTQTNNGNDRLVLFKNTGTAKKATFVLADTNFLNINATSPRIQRMVPTFGDLNGDGKPDLLIGDLNGKMHFFINTSVGSNLSFNKQSSDYFGIFGGTSATPQLVDLNKDGKLDIVMGRKNGSLAYFENKGTSSNPNFNSSPSIDSIGKLSVAEKIISLGLPYYWDGYSIPHVCDLDNDGRFEVLVGSEQGRVSLFRNFEPNANRVCEEIENLFSDNPESKPSNLFFGIKTAAFATDLDGDSIPELTIGNYRGGIRMYHATMSGIISSTPRIAELKDRVLIYPNPAYSEIKIVSSQNLNQMEFQILDILGNIQHTGTLESYETMVSVQNLKSGFYFLKCLNTNGNQLVFRFLKQD